MILSPEHTFDRITEFVYQGSRIVSMDDYHRLRAHGLRACVDLKHEGADTWSFDAFLWLPTVDHEAPSPTHLRLGMAFLRQCEAARLPVLVSCLAGVGRSSALVLAHLLGGLYAGRDAQAALQHLCARRPVARPTPAQVDAAVEAAGLFRA